MNANSKNAQSNAPVPDEANALVPDGAFAPSGTSCRAGHSHRPERFNVSGKTAASQSDDKRSGRGCKPRPAPLANVGIPICVHLRSFADDNLCVLAAIFAVLLALGTAGTALAAPGAIAFDLSRLDESGLYGPPDGLRALDYEYCIPQGQSYRDRVAAIDPSARFQPGSRGRIGCGSAQVLVLGNTHQPGHRQILKALAELPFVRRIVEAVFE
jgi:hypothetical protein